MKIKLIFSLLTVMLFCFHSQIQAQGPRGGGQRGVSRTALAQVEAVQKELELTDEQKTELSELRGARRGAGGGRGQRGEGQGKRGEGKRGEGKGGEGKGGQQRRGQRGARGRGAGGAEQVKQEIEKLSDILLTHQMTRLTEIYLQVAGQQAIQDPVVAETLKISDDQREQMQGIRDELREQMMELRESEDREQMREKMTEMNQQVNDKMMNVLTDDQKKELEEMKGEKFELPEDALPRRGRRGGDRSDF